MELIKVKNQMEIDGSRSEKHFKLPIFTCVMFVVILGSSFLDWATIRREIVVNKLDSTPSEAFPRTVTVESSGKLHGYPFTGSSWIMGFRITDDFVLPFSHLP